MPNQTLFLKLFTIGLSLFAGLCMPVAAQISPHQSVNAQLLVATRQVDLEGIQKSLERGASPNSRNRDGKTALFMGIEKNQIAIVRMMLAAGPDVILASLEKVTPLIAAAYAGNSEIIGLLLDKGAKLEEQDRLHKSALIYAAGMGHTSVVEQLLKADALINAAYADGLTPLMWAAGQGHTETVKLLLAKGAQKQLKDDRGLSAADMAKDAGHKNIEELLQ